jgi:hypothetical protein
MKNFKCTATGLLAMTISVQAQVTCVLSDKGLSSLKSGGVELLDDGVPALSSVTFESRSRDEKGAEKTVYESLTNQATVSVTVEKQSVVCAYSWGTVGFAYKPQPDKLGIVATFSNKGDKPIVNFSLRPLRLRFPVVPEGWDKPKWRVERSLDNVVAVPAVFGTQKVLACLDTVYPPMALGFGKPQDPGNLVYKVEWNGGVPASDPKTPRIHPLGLVRIEPGQSVSIEMSLRFAPADKPAKDIVGDLYAKFRAIYPPLNVWTNRGPIGMLMFPCGGKSENNPRGWFKKPEMDLKTPEGKADFRKQLMEYADRSVASMKAFNAQGGIVWNIEGEENPHPITYIGDPRMLSILAPEMDALADEFFAKFLAAGLRTGVTIRPTQVYFNEEKKAWAHGTGSHLPDRNPLKDDYSSLAMAGVQGWEFFPIVERMCRKIELAKKRWGCTIFYIDTNGIFAPVGEDRKFQWMLLTGDMLRAIKQRHPDVLLIPELEGGDGSYHLTNWGYGSQYMELDLKGYGTPVRVREIYPEAFSVVNIADGPIEEQRATLVKAVKDGDILMTRGWFGDSRNAIVNGIYEEAAK